MRFKKKIGALVPIIAVLSLAFVATACSPSPVHCNASTASDPGDNDTQITPYTGTQSYNGTNTKDIWFTASHVTARSEGSNKGAFSDDTVYRNDVPSSYTGNPGVLTMQRTGDLSSNTFTNNCVIGGFFKSGSSAVQIGTALSLGEDNQVVSHAEFEQSPKMFTAINAQGRNDTVQWNYIGTPSAVNQGCIGDGSGHFLGTDIGIRENFIESGLGGATAGLGGSTPLLNLCMNGTTGIRSTDSNGVIQLDQDTLYTRATAGWWTVAEQTCCTTPPITLTNNIFVLDMGSWVVADGFTGMKRCDDSGRINPCHFNVSATGPTAFTPSKFQTNTDNCKGNAVVVFHGLIDQGVKDAWNAKCASTNFVSDVDHHSDAVTAYEGGRDTWQLAHGDITGGAYPSY